MDTAIAFIRNFIQAEYEALIAVYTNPEDGVVDEKIRQAEEYFYIKPNHIMSLGFGRAPGMTEEDVIEMADEASDFQPRTLFQGKHYKHASLGDLYRFYASSYHDMPLLAYNSSFYVASLDTELKIISKYVISIGGNKKRLEWEYLCGTKINQLGDLIETRKFVSPESRAHKLDYDGESS
ncbi:hypothetical protein C7271_15335 [filamentous cyanobacterium CCP5]|nr:hypothetical protein C7271_15335 [filamentous cyanobacterium CCP5]